MAGFGPSYSVGGEMDTVKRVITVDEVKNVNFPAHLFPVLSKPYTKGFRMQIPPVKGLRSISYTSPVDLELIDVGMACSGYSDGDYFEIQVGDEKIMETIYTKELPQHINTGTTLYVVERIPAGTEIKMFFMNETGSTKTVWFDLRFMR